MANCDDLGPVKNDPDLERMETAALTSPAARNSLLQDVFRTVPSDFDSICLGFLAIVTRAAFAAYRRTRSVF
jgi:hypothetical protein